jgi:putative ABC transport system substrate-binding protein
MDRRRFLLALVASALAVPLGAEAQQAGKMYRVGYLGNAPLTAPVADALSGGLRQRGWVEGRNLVMRFWYSEGRNDRFPALATELILTGGTPATAAAKAATTNIPIVFNSVGDPVRSGFVASLARPGGNVTGLGGLGPGLHKKMLTLLKEAVPAATRIALFVNSTLSYHTAVRDELDPVAKSLKVTLKPVEVRTSGDLEGGFAAIAGDKQHALVILGQPMMFIFRAQIAKLALAYQMPTISVFDVAAEAGLLMSYG